MEDMLSDENVKPDLHTMNSYMAVFAEAVNPNNHKLAKHHNEISAERALEVFDSFQKYDLVPNEFTFKTLIRMHIRMKHLDKALEVKAVMDKKGLTLPFDGYGILIESLSHRDKLSEALNLLEEVFH